MQVEAAFQGAPGNLIKEMVQKGLITKDQLSVAEVTQKNFGGDLPNILIRKGFVREPDFLNFVAQRLGLKVVDLGRSVIPRNLLRLVPYHLVQKYIVMPLSQNEGVLTLAIADPFHLDKLKEELAGAHSEDLQFDFVIAPRKQIELAIRDYYQVQKLSNHWSDEIEIVTSESKNSVDPAEKVEELASSIGTVAAVDSILESACTDHASDVHIEPQENFIRVRLRVDGLLEEKHVLPIKMHMPIVSRIKIISGMNIAERRSPQDGRFSVKIHGDLLECRTSSYPTVYGEKIVIRLLTKGSLKKMEQLGMSPKDCETFKSWVLRPYGLLLVTGPTGSGKSTSLYAALQILNTIDRNIVSIEDPVENEVPGVNQAQVNNKANMTFVSALRSMLRQDPDVIMVGEVRDGETADMVTRAALTGHLVLSTLHTNTAVGAISRLLNLQIPPFLLSSSLVGVLGQRLVRRNCSKCLKEYIDETGEGQVLGLPVGSKVFRGEGCEACRHTGYTGRVGIYELFTLSPALRSLIEKGCTDEDLLNQAKTEGFRPMLEDGRQKILEGLTTISEVLRVTEAF